MQNVEQVAGGSSLVGTNHRTRCVQRWGKPAAWGQAVQRVRDLQGMPHSTKAGFRDTGKDGGLAFGQACHAQDRGGREDVLTMGSSLVKAAR
jgi:hypothetical protein